jgi:hypothetical protein
LVSVGVREEIVPAGRLPDHAAEHPRRGQHERFLDHQVAGEVCICQRPVDGLADEPDTAGLIE